MRALSTPVSDAKVSTGRQKPLTEVAFLFAEIDSAQARVLQAARDLSRHCAPPIDYRLADAEGPGRLDKTSYDLLASEARLASFLAIAEGAVPPEHWFKLGRSLTPSGTSRGSRTVGPGCSDGGSPPHSTSTGLRSRVLIVLVFHPRRPRPARS